MATEFLGLVTPDENDYYSDFIPSGFKGNMEKIDSAVKEQSEGISDVSERVSAVETQINTTTEFSLPTKETSVTGSSVCTVTAVPRSGRNTLTLTSTVSKVFALFTYLGDSQTYGFTDGTCIIEFDGDGKSKMTASVWTQFGETYTGVPADDFTATLKSGLSFELTTKAAYDSATSHDPTTVYYVLDGNKVTQYLGDTKLSSGSSANGVAVTLADSPAVQAEQGIEGFAECVTTEFSGSDFESVDNDDGVSGLTVRLTDWHNFSDNATGGVRVLSDKIGGSVVEYQVYCISSLNDLTPQHKTTSWLTAGKKAAVGISESEFRHFKIYLRLADGGTLTPEDITKITLEEETEET